MLNYGITEMTGPLETRIIHLRFYVFIQLYSMYIFCSLVPNPIISYAMSIQSNVTICAIHLNSICNTALTRIVSPLLGHLFIRKGHNSCKGRNFQYRYIVNPQHWKVNYLKDSL